MNLNKHPETLDRLAAAYALGSLRGAARRRFEAMARESPAVRASALLWRERLAAMTEIQTEVAPSPSLWPRIASAIAAQQAASPEAHDEGTSRDRPTSARAASGAFPTGGERLADAMGRALNWWRGLALAGALSTALALFVLLPQSAPEPPAYVAILSDERNQASMLVTYDSARASLDLKRLGQYRVPADKSLQLWALPPGAPPRSLGVLGKDAASNLPVADRRALDAPTLAISVEPLGGVSGAGGPTGPVIFKGAWVQTSL